MIPFSDSRFPGDAKPSHFQLSLRRRPEGDSSDIAPEVREELSQIIAYLEALRASIKDRKPGPVSSPQLTLPEQRDSRINKIKGTLVRLGYRFTDEPPLSEEDIQQNIALLTDSKLLADDTATPEPKPDEPKANEPKPGEPTMHFVPKPSPADDDTPRPRVSRRFVLIVAALLAVGGATAYLWKHPVGFLRESQSAAAPLATESPISSEATRTADLVLLSIQHGRLDEASKLLADAQKDGQMLPGLRYQAALLALRQGDAHAWTEWIAQSVAAREFVPECLYLRANSEAADGDYAAVCEDFEEAAGYSAFNPRYFFFWGEALRRYGHPAQALPQFKRALLCRPNSTDADLIRFKMGLAQIEAGADEKFDAYLKSLLTQKSVSGDTLLLAAAVAINRADYPEAAQFLQLAKQAMPSAMLSARLRDFLFQARARQPDLAAVWPTAIPAGNVDPGTPARTRVLVVDPATRSLAEADPAVW